jgi:predicted secreted hydrolase
LSSRTRADRPRAGGRLRHDERIARSGFGIAETALADTDVVLRDWRFRREGAVERSRYPRAHAGDRAGFGFDLTLETTQPVLQQGSVDSRARGRAPSSRAATTASRSSPSPAR